jgi:hypothetical protein
MSVEAAKAVVRRNTEEVQSKGNFDVFEEVFADDFVDHTPQPNMIPLPVPSSEITVGGWNGCSHGNAG